MINSASPVWAPGCTVSLRFRRADEQWRNLLPLRVIEDDGRTLLGWLPARTPIVRGMLADGSDIRSVPVTDRFVLPRRRVLTRWTGTSTLRWIPEDEASSVWWFFDPDGDFLGWYINLEIPLGRTDDTVDRTDGVLDLWVDPDRSWRWKDEDEADAAVAAGRLTTGELSVARDEGRRMIGLASAGRFPFDGSHADFRPDPGWPPLEIPERYLREVTDEVLP